MGTQLKMACVPVIFVTITKKPVIPQNGMTGVRHRRAGPGFLYGIPPDVVLAHWLAFVKEYCRASGEIKAVEKDTLTLDLFSN